MSISKFIFDLKPFGKLYENALVRRGAHDKFVDRGDPVAFFALDNIIKAAYALFYAGDRADALALTFAEPVVSANDPMYRGGGYACRYARDELTF